MFDQLEFDQYIGFQQKMRSSVDAVLRRQQERGDAGSGSACGKRKISMEKLPEPARSSLGCTIEPLEDHSRKQWVSHSVTKFACHKSGNPAAAPPVHPNNEFLALKMDEIANVFKVRGDSWRQMSYSKGAKILRGLKWEVTDASQLKQVRGFGDSLIDKVAEMLKTGRSSRLDRMQASDHTQVTEELCKVQVCKLPLQRLASPPVG